MNDRVHRWKCDVASGCRRSDAGDDGGTRRDDPAMPSLCPMFPCSTSARAQRATHTALAAVAAMEGAAMGAITSSGTFFGTALYGIFFIKKESHIYTLWITRIPSISTKAQFVRSNHQMCMVTFRF